MSIRRKIFGPSIEDVWWQLCNETGAEFIKGGFWQSSKVKLNVQNWTIVLDTFTQTTSNGSYTTTQSYTRIRVPYVSRDGFRFKIYRQNFFHEIPKLFGMQDIEVGKEQFDRDFIIQGNNEFKVKQLLANSKIRYYIQAQPRILLEVKDEEGWFGTKFPSDVDELYFVASGVIKDLELLKCLFALFTEVLNQLCVIGCAYSDSPNIVL